MYIICYMNSFFKIFSPKDKKFQPLFEQCGVNLVSISETLLLTLSTSDLEKRKSHIREIERMGHTGEQIRTKVFLKLSKSLITPFNREDIHSLISALYAIADHIHTAAISIDLYNILSTNKPMIRMTQLLIEMCKDLEIALKELKSFRNATIISDVCLRIYKGESKADSLCNHALAGLFQSETNAIELIKQKEILQTLEMATDKCDDVANVLESILVKNT